MNIVPMKQNQRKNTEQKTMKQTSTPSFMSGLTWWGLECLFTWWWSIWCASALCCCAQCIKHYIVSGIWVNRLESSRPIRSLNFSNYYIFWTVQPFFIIFCIKIEYHKMLKMLLSLFWKNTHLPKKGQKGPKVGRAVGKNLLFCILLKIASLDFFHILHKVRGH